MARRWTYSKVLRRIRHIAAADELRSPARSKRPQLDEEVNAEPSPLVRFLEMAAILVGVGALTILLVWLVAVMV